MKKSILFIIFFSLFSLFSLNLSAACVRVIDPNANGSFKVRYEVYFGDDYIICEKDDILCRTCPKCPPASSNSNYDPTDNTAMNALFTQADDAVFNQGNNSGNINTTHWVQGENQARVYNVTWSINQNGFIEMIFDRIS